MIYTVIAGSKMIYLKPRDEFEADYIPVEINTLIFLNSWSRISGHSIDKLIEYDHHDYCNIKSGILRLLEESTEDSPCDDMPCIGNIYSGGIGFNSGVTCLRYLIQEDAKKLIILVPRKYKENYLNELNCC